MKLRALVNRRQSLSMKQFELNTLYVLCVCALKYHTTIDIKYGTGFSTFSVVYFTNSRKNLTHFSCILLKIKTLQNIFIYI